MTDPYIDDIGEEVDGKGTRIGLALGSGGARGWAHIGVIQALQKAGIHPDIVCGTSIGSLIGAAHLGGVLPELEAWAVNLSRLGILRYLDIRMLGGGFIAGRKLQDLLADALDDVKIEDLDKRFVAVATDLTTGHEVWLRKGSLADAAWASFALPGIFPPVARHKQMLVDGALVNPIPVSACRAMGARLVIAVNLNTDHLGRRPVVIADDETASADNAEPGVAIPGVVTNGSVTGLLKQFLGLNNPDMGLVSVMASSLNIIQDRLTRIRLAGDPPDVTISPHVGNIALLEFNRAKEAIAEGERAVQLALPSLWEAMDILGIPKPGTETKTTTD
jgi:NTE family protein